MVLFVPMGLMKTGHQISGNGSHSGHSSYPHNEFFLGSDASSISGADSGNDSDGCELEEVGHELGIVEGQLCSIPYELYDLPDLKEILSMETWNSCLTEEERFSLSAYLPDMDQQAFWLTMKELLGGNDMFFGSPLAELFNRLKGGLYPQKVTRLREGLHFLQRRAYYQSLRLYHENMSRTFSDMKMVWKQFQSSISIEERVHIWKAWKNHKHIMNPLDLNAYPKNEVMLSDVVSTKEIMLPLSKRMKCIDSRVNAHILPPPVVNGMKLVALNTNAKGVLKIKPTGMSSFQARVPNATPSDTWAQGRIPPKGVLKIVPKGSAGSQQEQPTEMPMRSEPTPLIKTPGLHTSRLSPLPSSIYRWNARDYSKESRFLHQKVGGEKAYRSPVLPDCIVDQKGVDIRNSATGPCGGLQSSIRYVKPAKDPLFDSMTDSQEHDLFGGSPETLIRDKTSPKGDGPSRNPPKVRRHTCESENFWQNLDQETVETSKSFLEAYPFAAENYQGGQHIATIQEKHIATYPKTSEVVSRISDVGIGENEMFTTHLDHLKRHKYVNIEGSQKLNDQPEVSKGLQDKLVLSKTYRRRKAQRELKSLDIVKPQTVEDDFKSRTSQEANHLGGGMKAIKIKFKNRNDKSLQKQGTLNGKQHGSPSS